MDNLGVCDVDDEHQHSQSRTCQNWREDKKEPPLRMPSWWVWILWWAMLAFMFYLSAKNPSP